MCLRWHTIVEINTALLDSFQMCSINMITSLNSHTVTISAMADVNDMSNEELYIVKNVAIKRLLIVWARFSFCV